MPTRVFSGSTFIGSIGHIWVADACTPTANRLLSPKCPQVVHLLQFDYFTSTKYQLRPSWRKIYFKNFMRQFDQMTIYSEPRNTEIPTQFLKGHHTVSERSAYNVTQLVTLDARTCIVPCTYRSFPRTFIDSIGHIWVSQGRLRVH